MALPSYNIHPGYIARPSPEAWDDTKLSPEDRLATQREVYEFAHETAVAQGCRLVLDIGCGSGAKLIRWFPQSEFDTVGTETGPGVDWLRQVYPGLWWVKSDSLEGAVPPSDLVICADVIEHLSDPDLLLGYIARTGAKWIVLSTPDRDSLDNHSGPPRNPCHAREWSAPEFAAYIGSHFEVVRHFIAVRKPVCDGGSTQVILCRSKAGGL